MSAQSDRGVEFGRVDQLTKSVGVLVLLDIIGVYVYCLGLKKTYPPSHPWSGITLMLLSAGMMLKAWRSAGLLSWVMIGLTVLAASLWTVAAMEIP